MLFMVPPLAWNLIFARSLPMDRFTQTAPQPLLTAEGILRIAAIAYPLLLPIDTSDQLFLPGLITYSAGLALYFVSWTALMAAPGSGFASHVLVQFAPVYTPAIWLAGVSLMARSTIHPVLWIPFLTLHVAEYVIRYQR